MGESRERLPSVSVIDGPPPLKRRRFAQFPWSGVSALVGALFGITVCVGILVASDGNRIYQWRYQPTVYLSVSYTITNLLVALAFREGVTVNWWRTALIEHTTLGDLHRRYEYSNNLMSAILAGRRMNLVACAAILVAITPINGPLLQRASTIGAVTRIQYTNMSVPAATTLESDTGFVTGRSYEVSFLTESFQKVAQAFADGSSIAANGTGCHYNAMCTGSLQALGLAVQCNTTSPPIDLVPSTAANGSAILPSDYVFNTEFNWMLQSNPDQITVKAVSKQDPSCNTTVVQHDCILKPATVVYPIKIDGNASTISLDPESTIYDDQIVNSTIGDPNETMIQGPTHLGGFWMALQDQLSSSMELSFDGAVGYSVSTSGALAFPGRFANYSAATYEGAISSSELCNITFSDPLPYMLRQARELMFRKALADGNSSTIQQVSGYQVITENVFHSHYLFLGLALAITLTTIAIVSVTFHGYWQISRPVTMNPLVLAKAFDAPLMKQAPSNARVGELAKSVGKIPIRLGAVFRSALPGAGATENYEMSNRSGFSKEVDVQKPLELQRTGVVTTQSYHPEQRPQAEPPFRWPLQ